MGDTGYFLQAFTPCIFSCLHSERLNARGEVEIPSILLIRVKRPSQVERRLVIDVSQVLAFQKAPHSDVEE
jgi:hypothetical protein